MPLDLRKALPGDKLLLRNGEIRYHIGQHPMRTDRFLAGLEVDGPECGDRDWGGYIYEDYPDGFLDAIRNLSQEEREAQSKQSPADPWDGIIRLPARRCECCGQEIKS